MRCCPECGAIYRGDFDKCLSDGCTIIEVEQDPLIGKRIGQYKIESLLGQGGMGRVYRAHHAMLQHKLCALKVLIGDFATTTTMRIRFAQEAKNASRLSHPNIAAVTDFGRTDNGLLYIAMELVDGRSLGELIDEAPIPVARLISIARQLAEGLAHAHDLGLIHRDFKPDNVLVDNKTGVAKIVDFGLAIPNDQSGPRVTTTGLVMGTPLYIAPEQCTASDLDGRADLYALGVTMFEALSGGRVPFDGEPAEIVGLKVATAAPSLTTYAPHVPPGLASLVDRLLARKPDNRPPDARSVVAALDEIEQRPQELPTVAREGKRADTEADARSTPPPERTTPAPLTPDTTQPVRRSSSRIGIAIAGVSLALAVVAAAWILRPAGQNELAAATVPPPTPPTTSQPTPPPPAPPPAPTPTLEHEVAAADHSPVADDSVIEDPKPMPTAQVRNKPRTIARAPRRPDPAPVPVTPDRAPDPPPPVVQPPPPKPPVEATSVAVASLAVDGALPQAMVRRAVDRVMPAIRACHAAAGVVNVTFAIAESRRAIRTSASGGAPGAARCVATAIEGVRTESASDVGDVEVRLQIAFTGPG